MARNFLVLNKIRSDKIFAIMTTAMADSDNTSTCRFILCLQHSFVLLTELNACFPRAIFRLIQIKLIWHLMANSSDFLIRPAKVDDLSVVFNMIIKLSDYQKLDEPEMSVSSFVRDSGLGGGRKYFELLVMENLKSKKLVGYALYYYVYKTSCGLMIDFEDYFVESELRGTGLGRLLFKEVASIALKSNCKGIVLRALKWNPAVTVYERFGGKKSADIDGKWWQFTFDENALKDLVMR